jgi:hypothetical protein
MSARRPARLLGISAGGISHGEIQLGLFDDSKRRTLVEAVDSINGKFGKNAFRPASLLNTDKKHHITFGG